MNPYKDSTVLRFLQHYDIIEPVISKGSIVLAHGILEKIKIGITKSFYEENKTIVDKFITRLTARATELNIDSQHEYYKTLETIQKVINPQQMLIENSERFDLRPLKIDKTHYIAYTEKRKRSAENKRNNANSS